MKDRRFPVLARCGAALVAAALHAASPAAQEQSGEPQQVFRSRVDIVSLNVTVVDSENRYVTDLTRDDFTVYEDGTPQELILFNRSNVPIALSLLIDTSASMEGQLEVAQQAAIGFARTLREHDLAQVVDFDSRVEILQNFTNSVPDLERAILATQAGGSTSLHNALYISLRELAKIKATRPDEIRRQAIVVLSDGEDTSSLISFEEVLDLAKRSETVIYAIGLRNREAVHARGFKEAEFVLRQFALETGGRVFFPSRVEELRGVYARIANELSSQYSLGYVSNNPRRDGGWRRIVVHVGRPQVTARTKRGYYADGTR